MPTRLGGARRSAQLAFVILGFCSAGGVAAENPLSIDVTLKDHQFTPSEIHVPAGKPAVLRIKNEDATADEFDSSALKVEKIVPAHGFRHGYGCGRSDRAVIHLWASFIPTPPRVS